MNQKRILKLLHFLNTAWFGLCVAYLLILAMWQAGYSWWVIFSLSGSSLATFLLLICVYLFAIFRGSTRSHEPEIEHPLTSTAPYMAFYSVSPSLGGLAGLLGVLGIHSVTQILSALSVGTLIVTFMVWIVVDPLVGIIELLLPASRSHRRERLRQAAESRQREQREQEQLLAQLKADEEAKQQRQRELLQDDAAKLAGLLLAGDDVDHRRKEQEAIGIGVRAWRLGGMNCMRQVRDMTVDQCQRQCADAAALVEQVSVWWDGIGDWRCSS